MSLKDNLFSEDAEEDLEHFLRNEQRKRVLIFPPINNYRRFLIHQLVQDRYGDLLQTFSIGQGFARRTVVCYKTDYIGPPKVNGVLSQTSDGFGKSWTMGIESQCTPSSSPEHKVHKNRQGKTAPAYEIYRPPALRQTRPDKSPVGEQKMAPAEQNISDSNISAKANRPKRPDRAVYVPRHRRSVPEIDNKNVPMQETKVQPTKEILRTAPRRLDRNTFQQATKEKQVKNSEVEKMEVQEISDEVELDDFVQDTLEEPVVKKKADEVLDISEKVNDEEKLEEIITNFIPEKTEDHEICKEALPVIPNIEMEQVSSEKEPIIIVEEKMEEDIKPDITCNIVSSTSEITENKNSENSSIDLDVFNNCDENQLIKSVTENVTASSTTITEPCNINVNSNNKTVSEESKSSASAQKMNVQSRNERNDKPVKQTLVSKVLIISTCDAEVETKVAKPDPAPVITMTPPEKKVKKVERPKSKPAPPPVPVTKINRDECDWDSLFDDNGDCLDPTLIDELTSSVGEVVIEKPKSSLKSSSRPVEVSNDEFAHVIEIYNFPSEFKSSDLAAVFSPFKSGGFTLKWVDDTHCLGVFSSPVVAAEVLATDHPFVKTRPLHEATALSRSKVQKSSEFLQPYRTRPETCAALARRLVTKSLGVTLATARQEREQEKIVLREAKEKRRLANKQREDIWEGIITDKPET